MFDRRPFAWLLILFLLPLNAAAQDKPQGNPIVERMQSFAAAYNAADATAIGAFYTEDGVLLPPQTGALVGREAIAAHYAKAFEGGASNLRLNIIDIKQVGPGAVVEIGETLVNLGEQEIHGRYLHVWSLMDEEWFLTRDMYHLLAIQ